MLRYKIIIQYDGTSFNGWQIQKGHQTIQGEIEKALKNFMSKEIVVYGSGRTDSGVHALGQVAHFDLSKKIDPNILLRAINANLNHCIRIIKCELVDSDFHARFSAKKRHYYYRVRTDPFLLDHHYTHHISNIDIELLNNASKLIIGQHDFTSFSKHNEKIENRKCIIYESIWKESKSILNYHIVGNRFLHHMVRYLVGTMLEIGKNKYSLNEFKNLLMEPRERVKIYKAPAKALVLKQVDYE